MYVRRKNSTKSQSVIILRPAFNRTGQGDRGYAESRRPHERGVIRRHRRGTDDEVAPLYDIRVVVLANARAEGGKSAEHGDAPLIRTGHFRPRTQGVLGERGHADPAGAREMYALPFKIRHIQLYVRPPPPVSGPPRYAGPEQKNPAAAAAGRDAREDISEIVGVLVEGERAAGVEQSVGVEVMLQRLEQLHLLLADGSRQEGREQLAYAVVVAERGARLRDGVEYARVILLELVEVGALDDEDEVEVGALRIAVRDVGGADGVGPLLDGFAHRLVDGGMLSQLTAHSRVSMMMP